MTFNTKRARARKLRAIKRLKHTICIYGTTTVLVVGGLLKFGPAIVFLSALAFFVSVGILALLVLILRIIIVDTINAMR